MKTMLSILRIYWLCLQMLRLRIMMLYLQTLRFFLVLQAYGLKTAILWSGRRRVNGHSMEPILRDGDYILAQSIGRREPLKRGDILVFIPPTDDEDASLKRLCGLPGETVSLSRDGLIVNGERVEEPYVSHRFNPQGPYDGFEWTLGRDELILLGDNRFDSQDSRAYGPVKRSAVTRRVVVDEEGNVGHMP